MGLRFEPGGLVAVDAEHERLLPWPSPRRPPSWSFDPGSGTGAPALHVPEPVPLAHGWLGGRGSSPEALTALISFAEVVPHARAGFADPRRVAALIAHLAGAPGRSPVSAFAVLMDRDPPEQADPPSAATGE